MAGKRKRNTQPAFAFDSESSATLVDIYRRCDGRWGVIRRDRDYRAIGCTEKQAQSEIKSIRHQFNDNLVAELQNGNLERFKDHLEDWRACISYQVNYSRIASLQALTVSLSVPC